MLGTRAMLLSEQNPQRALDLIQTAFEYLGLEFREEESANYLGSDTRRYYIVGKKEFLDAEQV
jgi:hypothetical protein